MEAKVQKKQILGKGIRHFHFFRRYNWNTKKVNVNGVIWLDKGCVSVENGKFYVKDSYGEKVCVILKNTSAYKKIKRMIARYFSDYRKNGNCQFAGEYRKSINKALENLNKNKLKIAS